jgi:murein DD-endopeptidase MepM/ murein hydrolase activator NlpD
MRSSLLSSLLVALLATPAHVAAPATVHLRSGPARVLIEQLPERQDLNFELFVDNPGAAALTIGKLQVSAYDAHDRLLLRRLLDDNGVRPSIQTLPERTVAAGQTLTVFNPFASFARDLPLARLHYEMTLATADGAGETVATLDVLPQRHAGHAALRLPLRGRLINYDGHDFYAHHRRFDYSFAPLAQLGFKSNFMRYSYDFVPVDASGAMHRGSGADNADYFGFGAPVLATGDGVVVALVNTRADDRHFEPKDIAGDPMSLFGNYLVIDHGQGEFSVYGHLKQGSVRLALGQRLRRGEPVAQIGASGSAFFPHLHYELQDAADTRAEGLPSYFGAFHAWVGDRAVPRTLATVDTGEIVEAD